MALPQNTYVYMETMETSKNKEKKSDKDGSTRILCEHGSKLPKRTLNGITFDVLSGEYLGIMGASGSGKTTLLNCIATADATSN